MEQLTERVIGNEVENGSKFYTDQKIPVTERIKNRKTKVFLDRKTAVRYARSRKSYIYELFVVRKISKFEFTSMEMCGYAVPK